MNAAASKFARSKRADGSWVSGGKEEADQGPVYGTTFSALSLMVYYRFLPTYQPIQTDAKPTEKSADDVVVEVI